MGTLTRAGVEAALTARIGTTMMLVGLDGTTSDGTNASLVSPIRESIRAMGFDTADPLAVVDADLAPISGYYVDRLLTQCELYITQQVLSQWERAMRAYPGEQDKEWLKLKYQSLQDAVAKLESECRKPVRPKSGTGLAPMGGTDPRIPNTRGVTDRFGYPFR